MKMLKKIKIIAVVLAVSLTLSFCSMSAYGLEEILGGLAGSSDASALDDIFGGLNLEGFDVNSILDAFSGGDYSGILGSVIASLGDEYAGFTNNEIFVAIGKVINDIIANGGDVSAVDFDSAEFIAMLSKYLNPSAETTTAQGETTTAVEETTQPEATTVAPEAETRPPETAAPVEHTAPPSYVESPIYVTNPPETTTAANYEVVTQATVTMPELTQQYNVTDDVGNNDSEDGVTKKMIIGIIILVLSAIAVVVVAVFLKKNRE